MARGVTRAEMGLAVIVILLATFLTGLYTAYNELEARSSQLAEDYEALRSRYEHLNATYQELLARYQALNESYHELLSHLTGNITLRIINDRDYFTVAKELVDRANESIYVIMYVMKYDADDPVDPANDLIRALRIAHDRGVEVAIILEGAEWVRPTNEPAYNYFVEHGMNVTWDPEGVTTHCKLIVIDRYIVLLGSHNWTESALSYNHETSVLIISREVAELEITYFNQVWAEATGS